MDTNKNSTCQHLNSTELADFMIAKQKRVLKRSYLFIVMLFLDVCLRLKFYGVFQPFHDPGLFFAAVSLILVCCWVHYFFLYKISSKHQVHKLPNFDTLLLLQMFSVVKK